MASFPYRALNLAGEEIRGVIRADTRRQARSLLRAQQLIPLDLGQGEAARLRPQRSPRLRPALLAALTRQWASLLEAGIPVERALAALAEQHEDAELVGLLGALRQELLAGHPLHQALAAHPRSFDSLYCALVAAGEHSGQLDQVMLRLADNLEQRGALRGKLIQALVYPALVMLVAGAVILALLGYVVPQVIAVFQNGKHTLPLLTRGLILVSDTLRQTWPLLLAGALGGLGLLRHALQVPALRRRWQARLLRVPLLGRLLRSLDSARLAQTLAILVSSGVPLLRALQAATAVVWLLPVREALEQAGEQLREGMTLNRALAASGLFPPLLVHMVASGESSGQLDAMLARAARQQADEVSSRLGLAMSLLEPLLILVMGLFVLLIVLAILQPIIEINQLLR